MNDSELKEGDYAMLEVVGNQDFGAFVDWGKDKDLLIPNNQQTQVMREGELHLVRICLDAKTNKLYGTCKFGRYLENEDCDLQPGDKVKIVPVEDEDLGYRCIINKKYLGMIYYNEIFKDVEFDVEIDGYVKKIREDGLIDAALQIQGIKNLDNSQVTILNMLKANGGKSDLHDKSTPDQIKKELSMSKQTFKRAIGMLYKQRKIIIEKTGIELIP